jgi:hypothetical protein
VRLAARAVTVRRIGAVRFAPGARWLHSLAAALVCWSVPAIANACPVCFAAKDEANRVAFLATTVFLTAAPIILIGCFLSWAARRVRALEAETGESFEATAEPASGTLPTASPIAAERSEVVALRSPVAPDVQPTRDTP